MVPHLRDQISARGRELDEGAPSVGRVLDAPHQPPLDTLLNETAGTWLIHPDRLRQRTDRHARPGFRGRLKRVEHPEPRGPAERTVRPAATTTPSAGKASVARRSVSIPLVGAGHARPRRGCERTPATTATPETVFTAAHPVMLAVRAVSMAAVVVAGVLAVMPVMAAAMPLDPVVVAPPAVGVTQLRVPAKVKPATRLVMPHGNERALDEGDHILSLRVFCATLTVRFHVCNHTFACNTTCK